MQSFSRRVFGGSPDSFRLTVEYGPATAHSYSHPHGQHYQLRKQPSQQVRLPVAAARVEFEWTNDDAESDVVERFAQRISATLDDLMEERVVVDVLAEDIDHAASFPNNRVRIKLRTAKVPPVLRNVQLKARVFKLKYKFVKEHMVENFFVDNLDDEFCEVEAKHDDDSDDELRWVPRRRIQQQDPALVPGFSLRPSRADD